MESGGMNAPKTLERPLADTLYFAGEALSSAGVGGTVDDALTSGIRAAKRIVKACHPSTV
jgi:monoamine oxidase